MAFLSCHSLSVLYALLFLFTVSVYGKPAAFFLAGDSTTATKGGWGDGFLSLLEKPAIGTNHAKNGRTTVSFKQGHWNDVMSNIKKHAGQYQVYVTIQFGHNDQKPQAGISIQQYQNNLASMAAQVKSAGGIPILITPLTRRSFKGNKVVENLANERKATIAAAQGGSYLVLDLNAESTRYVNAIGQSAASKYNLKEGDMTHLNSNGGLVFGQMVANLLTSKVPDLGRVLKRNERIATALKAGKPA